MPQTLTIGVFVLGAVLLLLALTSGGFRIFGAEMSGASGQMARAIAAVLGLGLIGLAVAPGLRIGAGSSQAAEPANNAPANAAAPAGDVAPSEKSPSPPSKANATDPSTQASQPPQTAPSTAANPSALPAGEIIDGQDSVQILNVTPAPGSYLRRGAPQSFHLTVAYYLQSADQAIMSVSVAQIPSSTARCASPSGQLTDATDVGILRGRHKIDLDVTWSGDSPVATKGHVDTQGYLKFVPMFWHGTNDRRTDRFAMFHGYDTVCMAFGP